MKLTKLYESLGLEKLDESKQKELTDYITEAINIKVDEKVIEKLDEKLQIEKNILVEKYEEKFEEYKEEITEKFSNFVDDILEEELIIPEKIKTYAKLGEKYEPILENIRLKLGIEEGTVDEQAKELLKEAKDEIIKLKEKTNDLMSENMELESDAKIMATEIYLFNKCKGLTESKKEKVIELLEGITDIDVIDKKFDIIIENYKIPTLTEKTMYCPNCNTEYDVDDNVTDSTCNECGTPLKEGKGEGNSKKITEEFIQPHRINEGFDIKEHWKKVLRGETY